MAKLKERDCKRGMDLLVREFPNKTGAEILAIYEQDIVEYNNYLARINKQKLERVQWLKDNPYLKIVYKCGSDLILYLHITDARFQHDEVIFDAIESKISSNKIIGGTGSCIETKRPDKLRSWYNYYTGNEELIVLTKEQYDEFHEKVENLSK
jgi:hypothetical protein